MTSDATTRDRREQMRVYRQEVVFRDQVGPPVNVDAHHARNCARIIELLLDGVPIEPERPKETKAHATD
jgi:hypothetical protein